MLLKGLKGFFFMYLNSIDLESPWCDRNGNFIGEFSQFACIDGVFLRFSLPILGITVGRMENLIKRPFRNHSTLYRKTTNKSNTIQFAPNISHRSQSHFQYHHKLCSIFIFSISKWIFQTYLPKVQSYTWIFDELPKLR